MYLNLMNFVHYKTPNQAFVGHLPQEFLPSFGHGGLGLHKEDAKIAGGCLGHGEGPLGADDLCRLS